MRLRRPNFWRALSVVALTLAVPNPSPASSIRADVNVRVRGEVVSRSAEKLDIKSRDGALVRINLKQGWMAYGAAKAAVTDIKPGDYIGIASLREALGGDGAVEVIIFPPAMKGLGEGSYAWELQPDSSMTNATVSDARMSVVGSTVTVRYHGQEKKISIPARTPVVALTRIAAGDVKAGAIVFVTAERGISGGLTAAHLVVGINGVIPPM